MYVTVLRLPFFCIQVVKYVACKYWVSLSRLFSGLPNVFFMSTATDYNIKVGSSAAETCFKDDWFFPIFEFKESTLKNIIVTKGVS